MISTQARLHDRVAIVTGAAQGIGAHYAERLAAEGAKVVCSDIEDCTAVVSRIRDAGGDAIAVRCDVTSSESVEAMVSTTVAKWGRIDVLVNNAALFGKIQLKPFEQITSDEWDVVMRVNVRGAFECSKAVTPTMRAQKYGKIINVASGTVFKGTPMFLHYVTSKGAIVAMSRCLARELGNDNICVNTIAPGLTLSENVASNNDWAGDIGSSIVSSRCFKREQLPEDLGGSLVYLASADSDFVTGQVIVVDGGSVTH
jgi:NAD(P)-dependent dehydrogenase (short-subunit alcohol dehydrogenase family)